MSKLSEQIDADTSILGMQDFVPEICMWEIAPKCDLPIAVSATCSACSEYLGSLCDGHEAILLVSDLETFCLFCGVEGLARNIVTFTR